jgi:hypothetical protein
VVKSRNKDNRAHLLIVIFLTTAILQQCALADKPGPSTSLRAGWQKEQADWRLTGGSRIKSITYPQEAPPLTRSRRPARAKPRRKQLAPDILMRTEFLTASDSTTPATGTTGAIFATVIDSPPIDGFVPWIAVSVTNKREAQLELEAITEYSIVGSYLTGNPQSDYAIGIYDTGASAHVMGYSAAVKAGLFSGPGYITSNTTIISGVTGEVEAWVSEPIGIFIDGLGAIEPNGLLWDRSGMMGQSNVAIAVGQGGSPVDLPTAIGSPLSVYFTAVFDNGTQISVTRDGNDYSSPDIRIYQQDDPEIPTYANLIPLELRPLGGVSVQYIFDIEDFDFPPASPSVIIGNTSQSIFFAASVDLYDGIRSAIDKTRFLFDTGAQITVVGSRIAARLELNPANPEFEVEIQGITGDVIIAPGFYIDTIEIPALGEWLSLTNVPVVLLDIPSPEGGTVDGVIGMNLFVDLNFVLRGGGLFLQDDPSVEYEPISRLAGDIAPEGGDGKVDYLDLAALTEAWLANPMSANWNGRADMAGDAIINFRDFAVMAQNWE